MRNETVVKTDQITTEISKHFDYLFDGTTSFVPPAFPEFLLPFDYRIGLIVGPSGTGKSTILNALGKSDFPEWDDDKAVCSHFTSSEEAIKFLGGVGLNSIPTWMKPYRVLSTGEKFRADMARMIKNDARIDEFTSVVDRTVAKSCCVAINRLIHKDQLLRVVFATCHYDIIDWLQPDWIFDTRNGEFFYRGLLRRPYIEIQIAPCSPKEWTMFSHHHYLTGTLNTSARCWIALWDGTPVGFVSSLAYPSGSVKNAWREHRTVVLPDYQGFGIGVRISDAVAQMFKSEGYRYFSKTAHPRMGEYRENSPLWKPTSKNKRDRQDYRHNNDTKESAYKHLHQNRVTYSHEFVGDANA